MSVVGNVAISTLVPAKIVCGIPDLCSSREAAATIGDACGICLGLVVYVRVARPSHIHEGIQLVWNVNDIRSTG